MTAPESSSRGPTLLAVIAVLVAVRWAAMASPEPYRAVFPDGWFEPALFGLTRLGTNSALCWLLLVLVPIGLWYWRLRAKGPGFRQAFAVGAARFNSRRDRVLFAACLLVAPGFGLIAAWLVPGLRDFYPLYRAGADLPGVIFLGKGLVAAILLATELFYRGAALFALERHYGLRSIFLLAPIYALDHLGAPWPEVLASLLAGIGLGYLALRWRSIWPGFALHLLVAWSVDLGGLWFSGLIP